MAKFPKQKPHLHQICYHQVPDTHSRHQRRGSHCLLHRLLSGCSLSSYVIWWSTEKPLAHPISHGFTVPPIKISLIAQKDYPRVQPLFNPESTPLLLGKVQGEIHKLSSKYRLRDASNLSCHACISLA